MTRALLTAAAVVVCHTVLLSPGAAAAKEGVSGARAKALAAQLAALGPRPAGSTGERRARSLVARELRRWGYRVLSQPFGLPRGGSSGNVVGLVGGNPRVLLAAHLDSVSGSPGANDNGSGVGVLLEVARVLAEQVRGGLGRGGVVIALLGAEERAETGVRVHLGSLRLLRGISRVGKSRIRLALVLDMVGVGSRLHVRGIEAAPNRSARLVLRQHERASYLPDPGHSDHAEMSRAGLPAAWLQWRDDACWHSPCDTARRLDEAKLQTAAVVALAAAHAALTA